MVRTLRPLAPVLLVLLVSCSSSGSGRKLRVGQEGGHGGSGTGGAGSGGDLDAAVAGNDGFGARVENIQGVTVELVTLACAGGCASVVAVAHGGNAPYAFEWDDGSTTPDRHVCLSEDAVLSVSVTDTAIVDSEFPYAARTATAEVTADVLDCADGGVPSAECMATSITPPPAGRYLGNFSCPAPPSSGGAANQTGAITLDLAADGTGTLFVPWAGIVIGAQGTIHEPDCQDGSVHATYDGQWGVPGAPDPNMPDAPPPLLPTGPITGQLTLMPAVTPNTITGIFHWDVPAVAGGEPSVCRGTFVAELR